MLFQLSHLKKKLLPLTNFLQDKYFPFHTDLYEKYKSRNNIKEEDDIQRVIVFLTRSKGRTSTVDRDRFCTGETGNYFGWDHGTEHMAANLGHEDRYVLQVTGVKC